MVKGYKGFNKDLQCTPDGKVFQYEIGKEYEEPEAQCCKNGFHFCENPLDVFEYYPPANSRYCAVVGEGEVSRDGSDSKLSVSKIKIGAEIGLLDLIKAGVEYIKSKIDWKDAAATNTGDWSAATNTGNQSAATNTGNRSAATNTGYWSAATNTGDWSAATNTGNRSAAKVSGIEAVAVSLGIEGTAKGELGCWIVLAEWKQDRKGIWHRKNVKSHKVDGKSVLPNVSYKLQDGKFVKA